MTEGWSVVMECPNETVAESIVEMLQAEGIPAVHRPAPFAQPGLFPGPGEILVPEDRVAEARAILEAPVVDDGEDDGDAAGGAG